MTKIIYSPVEAASLAVSALEDLRNYKNLGLRTGIRPLDEVLMPMRPGELVVVIGYTSWYKSGLMNFMLRSAVKQCETNDVVIKATWEDSVEEETIKWISADANIPVGTLVRGDCDNWDAVMRSYSRRLSVPLWIIGHSTSESASAERSRPRLTMTDITNAVGYIKRDATDAELKPRMIVLDYLQRIRPDPSDGGTKREQMMEAVNKAKDLAVSMGCPVVLGVQAGRAVLDRDYKLPRIDDGQETSNIEQSADKILSVWFPIKTEEDGELIEHDKIKVSPNLLIVGVLKQKFGVAPVTMPLWVDPARNHITGIKRVEGG